MEEKHKKGFIIYLDQKEIIEDLTDEEVSKLFKSFFDYNLDHSIPKFGTKLLNQTFKFFKITFDRDNKKYVETCRKNKENAKKRWDKLHKKEVSDRIRPHAMDANRGSDIDSDSDRGIDSDIDRSNTINNKNNKRERVGGYATAPTPFFAPTLEDVVEYGKNLDMDKKYSEKFFYYYESKDWEGIKSWKAKMRYWVTGDDIKTKKERKTIYVDV